MPRSSDVAVRGRRCCACRIVTSGFSAGTVASDSPVYGQVTARICGLSRRQIGADVAAQHRRTASVRRPRGIGRGHAGMRVLVDRERMRPAVLDRIAQPVQRTDAGIAAPGERQRARAAHADHLVVDQVRRHADQVQVAPALADDLVPGSERDQVREALQRDGLRRRGRTGRSPRAACRSPCAYSTSVCDCSRWYCAR